MKEVSVYDRIWHLAEWYRNDEHPLVQRFQFTGRFQADYAVVARDSFEDLTIRRFRVGAKAQVLCNLTLHTEVELQPEEAHVYQRLTDAYLAWSRHKNFVLTVGKHSAPFTLDGSTSSTRLLAVGRGNLANNLWFPEEYIPGISASGQPGNWRYFLGLYSSGSRTKEFGRFDGGAFALATLGYDFASQLKLRKAALALNYVCQERDRENSFTRPLADVASLNFTLEHGRWGLRGDLAGGLGYGGQSDLWAAMLMPSFDITPRLQAVARLTRLESRDDDGLRLARYENRVVSGRGDAYSEIYLGLNYYFYGHKLKLQTGVQYAEMRDRAEDGGAYAGWAWTSGLRISW